MYMTRQEIFDQIWVRTVQGFVEDYELNYALFLKVLRESGIPKPGRKDIIRLQKGKEGMQYVTRPDLPGNPDEEVRLPRRRDAAPVPGEEREPKRKRRPEPETEEILWEEPSPEELDPRWNALFFLPEEERKNFLKEADRLVRDEDGLRHPLTRDLQRQIASWQAQKEILGEDSAMVKELTRPEFVDRVSEQSLDRILWILDRLYGAVERLGGRVLENGSVLLLNQEVQLKITESQIREPREATVLEEVEGQGKLPKWKFLYTGKLSLSVGGLYAVRDRKYDKLEDRLGEALELLYHTAHQFARHQEEEDAAENAKLESFHKEMGRVEVLIQQARDYEDARRIRELILGVQKKLAGDDLRFQAHFPEWAAWASEKAEWLDPTIAAEDAVLGRRHAFLLDPGQRTD